MVGPPTRILSIKAPLLRASDAVPHRVPAFYFVGTYRTLCVGNIPCEAQEWPGTLPNHGSRARFAGRGVRI